MGRLRILSQRKRIVASPAQTTLDFATCDRARLARDAAFDRRFVTAVKTTRIYCRPTCPAGSALSKNVIRDRRRSRVRRLSRLQALPPRSLTRL
jgi:hypothetical protein